MESPNTPTDDDGLRDPFAGFWSKPTNIVGMSILGGIALMFVVLWLILDTAEPAPTPAEEQQREDEMRECLDSGQTVEECANPRLNP